MNARYYDSKIGRFITQDTYRGEKDDAGTWHLYTYCANDPINYVDPSGHIAITTCVWIGAGIGIVVGGAVGAYYSKKKYNSIKWKYIVGGALVGAAVGAGVGYGIGLVGGVSGSSSMAMQARRLAKKASRLTYSKTIRNYNRKYYKSSILIREIIKSKNPVIDGGRRHILKWVVPGTCGRSVGVWELVIDTSKDVIVHFLFNSKPR